MNQAFTTSPWTQQLLSLTLAAVLTLATLGGLDGLAQQPAAGASAGWAAAPAAAAQPATGVLTRVGRLPKCAWGTPRTRWTPAGQRPACDGPLPHAR